jgi:hypothetical protein
MLSQAFPASFGILGPSIDVNALSGCVQNHSRRCSKRAAEDSMSTTRLLAIFLAFASMLALGQAANAQPNTFSLFSETLTNTCTEFCSSVVRATDPLSGLTTVEYTLVPLGAGAPPLTPGDFLIEETGSSTIGDVLRFEVVNGLGVVFFFSDDISAGLPADVGLPASFQALTQTIDGERPGFTYTLTSSDPGAPHTFTFELDSADVPEPDTLALLGAGLICLGIIWRLGRRHS